MRRTFHLLRSAPLIAISAATGCLAIDWGGYRVVMCGDEEATACVSIPAGWAPIRATQVGDPSTPPGTCEDGSPQGVYFTGPAGAAACPCQCSPAAAAKCSAPEIDLYYSVTNCSGAANAKTQLSAAGCADLPGIPSPIDNLLGSCKLGAAAKVLDPACDAAAHVTEPMWGGAVLVCADSPRAVPGCDKDEVCIAKSTNAGEASCIQRPGTDPCPDGWGQAITAFTGGDDTRSCGACACTLDCSGGSYVVHDHTACGDNAAPVTVDSPSCVAAPGIFDGSTASVMVTLATPVVSMCMGGGPAEGQVNPTGPVQICCR